MKHGGDLSEAALRFGEGAPRWLDLSTGINPHPWPLPRSGLDLGLERLPPRADLVRLLSSARDAYDVPAGLAVVAAPGTQLLIGWLPRLAPPGPVAILEPTYAEHADTWRAAGAVVRPIAEPADLPRDVRHLVAVNPNNPDGRVLAAETLKEAARTCRARGGWLIVDESFADTDSAASVVGRAGDLPVIVLRSFGKFYGLAGLRLGFAIAPPGIAASIEAALGPWAVSGPALAIGAVALADRAWAEAMRARLRGEAAALDAVLAEAGLDLIGGTSLFRLARHPRAVALHEALARRHIWVRRFPAAPDRLRFGLPPDPAARDRLAGALAEALPLR